MTWGAAIPKIDAMQPTSTSTSTIATARPTTIVRTRRAAALVLAGALLLVGCGSGDDAASTDTTAAAAGSGSGTEANTDGAGDDGSSTTAATDDGAPDVDICSAITAEDLQGLVPAADPITATPNEVIPAPTCDYTIQIGEGATAMDAAIVSIQLTSTDPAYYASQEDLQRDQFDDVTPVDGVEEGFSYDDAGTIMMTTDAGVWLIERGVEVNKEATAQLSAEEMAAVAALVDERL